MAFEIPLEAINWEVENQLKPTIFRISFRPFLKYSTVDSRSLEPKSISPGFPSYIYCNFTLGNSNPQ